MKKGLIVLLLVCPLWASSQKDISDNPVTTLSDSTAIGAPDGNLVSKEIGPAGGTITSDDGRVELVFPAGALAMTTTISIQPTTNLAANGVGKSYWFEPSGILFKKPVQIIFQYTENETEICPPEWMSLAIQDEKGKWTFVDYAEWDSTGKKLKGFIHHFSGASNINDIQLRVEKFQVPVKGYTFIDVVDVSRLGDPSGYDAALVNSSDLVIWYVEEVPKGDDISGRIEGSQMPLGKGTKFMSAKYTAPAVLPPRNSVTIWAEIYRRSRNGKKLRKRLKAYVSVYDAYKVQVIHHFTGRLEMGSKLIDSASCIVWVYSYKINITGVNNYPPAVLQEGRNGPFTEIFFNQNATGSVHITEAILHDSLIKTWPPGVYFEIPSSKEKVLWYRFKTSARGFRSDVEPVFAKTISLTINFIADGKPQEYEVATGSAGKFTLIVTPYRVQ